MVGGQKTAQKPLKLTGAERHFLGEVMDKALKAGHESVDEKLLHSDLRNQLDDAALQLLTRLHKVSDANQLMAAKPKGRDLSMAA